MFLIKKLEFESWWGVDFFEKIICNFLLELAITWDMAYTDEESCFHFSTMDEEGRLNLWSVKDFLN